MFSTAVSTALTFFLACKAPSGTFIGGNSAESLTAVLSQGSERSGFILLHNNIKGLSSRVLQSLD